MFLIARVLWLVFSMKIAAALDCLNNSSPYVNNEADVMALNQCPIYQGDVILNGSLTGNVSIDGLISLRGGFRCNDLDGIINISSTSLFDLATTGSFTFQNDPDLKTIDFPHLQQIGYALRFENLPELKTLNLAPGCNVGDGGIPPEISIQDTSLPSFENVTSKGRMGVQISNNKYMSTVELLQAETGDVNVSFNAPKMSVNLPNLLSIAGDLTLGNCSELSIPALGFVNGSFQMINASFAALSAPYLSSINGTLNITGAFSNASLPALSSIIGDFIMQSSEPLDCGHFRQYQANGIIGGSFVCEGTPPKTAIGTMTPTGPSGATNPGSPLPIRISPAAKGGIAAGTIFAAILILLLGFCIIKRRRKAKRRHLGIQNQTQQQKHELPQGRHYERAELNATPNQVSELKGDQTYPIPPPIETLPIVAVPPPRTALHWTAEKGNEAVVLLLVEKGADEESENAKGRTPLSWASARGHEAVVQLLLEKGVDVESGDTYDLTPLHWAAKKGHSGW